MIIELICKIRRTRGLIFKILELMFIVTEFIYKAMES